MKKLLFAFAFVIIASCNDNSETSSNENTDTAVAKPEIAAVAATKNKPSENLKNCYRYVSKRDTYDIEVAKTGEYVSGLMHFNNYQKDDSRGNFTGTIVKDNIIKVIYKFESEGTKSTREIFLKDNGNEIVTGIGDEDVEGDSAFVKDPDAVKFTGPVYKKMDCSEIK